MSYKLAIFDLDGTILNTLEDLADSLNFVCLKYNFPTFSYEEVKYMVGNGIPKLIERALPQGKDNPFYKDCLNDYISYYEKHRQIKTCPYPEMKETLLKLKEGGVKLGVNSNKIDVDKSVSSRSPCNKCWARYLCGGTCFYGSQLTTGNILAIDPVECRIRKHIAKLSLEFIVFCRENKINL